MLTWKLIFALTVLLSVNIEASLSKVNNKPASSFLRDLQTECDCSDYTGDVCLGYDYNGEGGSALPSNFEECGEVCCECSCSAVTVELCVACLDAGACNSFLTSCAKECCILQDAPAQAPQKWGGWGDSSGSWGSGGGGGGQKPPSKPKPAPKPKGGKYKSGGGAKKGKKSKYSSGGGYGGYSSSSWSGSTGSAYDHIKEAPYGDERVAGGDGRAPDEDGQEEGRADAGDGPEGEVGEGTSAVARSAGGANASGATNEPEPQQNGQEGENRAYAGGADPETFRNSFRDGRVEENEKNGRSQSNTVASVSSKASSADSSVMTQTIFGMSRTVFFCVSLLAISVIVALVIGLNRRNTVKEGIDEPLQEMPGSHDASYVRSA